MLTYAFDLLYVIYEEEGYESAEIPEKILTNNLYGIEIDERAGELAAFALTMKARAKQRRFFSKGVKPNICVLENVHFDEDELNDYMEFVGRDLLTAPLQTTLRQFEEADNLGSLIRPEATDVDGIIRTLEVKDVSEQLFLSQTHQKVLQALGQADYLAPKYHVVIANPPYMGSRNMNGRLSTWLKDNFSNFKSDLFSAFMVRNTELSIADGYIGYMTPFTWLTLSSHEPVRRYLLRECTMMNLVKPSYTAFFDSAIVSVCAFSVRNGNANVNFDAAYFDLGYLGSSKVQAQRFLQGINGIEPYAARYRSREDFLSIPGAAFSFQMSKAHISSFRHFPRLGSWAPAKQGLATGKNDLFVRAWPEVSIRDVGFGYSDVSETESCDHKWFPYNKGGDYRRWYGNNDYVVDWESNGERIKSFGEETGKVRSRAQNTEYYFKPGVTWSFISSSNFGARYSAQGFIFDVAGSSVFPQSGLEKKLAGFMASSVAWSYLKLLNPTVNFQVGNIADLPVSPTLLESIDASISNSLIKFAKGDWDSGETSWDFKCFPLLNPDHRQPDLKTTYQNLRAHWQNITLEVQRLEEENNHIFIDAYGLQDELAPEVPLGEITLTCNPHYRYGGNKSEEELETLLLADTMRELVSYAVGCMFGRYALDKPGLILASQGETLADYLKQVPEPCFMPDADNAIPMMEGEWFADNINIRFREFLRITFGEKHFEGNLKFVEQALGKDLRKYFAKDFYGDHVKRYKKRPIYWLFSSPRGSFQVLIYMHRYRPDTVSVVLNDYLREFRTKLTSHKNHLEAVSISASSSPSEKTKALKEIEKTTKMIVEMEEYEREVLYPLATQQVEIDLDDGVKVNYPKLGAALKKIAGLEAKDD